MHVPECVNEDISVHVWKYNEPENGWVEIEFAPGTIAFIFLAKAMITITQDFVAYIALLSMA